MTVIGFQYGSWGMQRYGNQQSKVRAAYTLQ